MDRTLSMKSLDIDSGSEENNFFEGTEKLLEIWFSFKNDINSDLRTISRASLDDILDHVKAKIISHSKSNYWDAYVLSESSLFVSKNRIILKTCGSTTLLLGLKPLLDAVNKSTSASHISKLFYSRKCMLKPEEQHYPHIDFNSETLFLKDLFPDGSSFIFGEKIINEYNQWVTFVYEAREDNGCFDSFMFNACSVELLMNELDETSAYNFYKQSFIDNNANILEYGNSNKVPHNSVSTDADHSDSVYNSYSDLFHFDSVDLGSRPMIEKSGLADFFDKKTIVDYTEFNPFGLSINALNAEIYHTIHVTPQKECSYASYETNMCDDNMFDNLARIIDIFQPKSFVLNVFDFKRRIDVTSFHPKYKLIHLENRHTSECEIIYGYFEKSSENIASKSFSDGR